MLSAKILLLLVRPHLTSRYGRFAVPLNRQLLKKSFDAMHIKMYPSINRWVVSAVTYVRSAMISVHIHLGVLKMSRLLLDHGEQQTSCKSAVGKLPFASMQKISMRLLQKSAFVSLIVSVHL